jgi:hypothetical protein
LGSFDAVGDAFLDPNFELVEGIRFCLALGLELSVGRDVVGGRPSVVGVGVSGDHDVVNASNKVGGFE